MTATTSDQAGTIRPVPRLFLQTFWRLHRAMYRVTGGRLGLQRPESGSRFGMLRIHTVGRRSGKQRVTMLGYFEDGPNLVTLAMNGWGKTEPSWWLNLQARPTATIESPDGRRDVTARVAVGPERERLWATFKEFPGWGEDIGALAANRPGPTAVVVLEPAGTAGSIGGGTTTPAGTAQSATVVGQGNRRRLRWRHLWIVPGLAVAIVASELGKANGVGILALVAFGIAPDLPRLFGIRGRPVHNVLHQPLLPLAAMAVAGLAIVATGSVPALLLVGALVWFSHVIIGWGIGDVPRPDAKGSHG